jgi:hypothetical protein
MELDTVLISQILMAFVVFGNFSAAYQNNFLFRILGSVILGFATASQLVDSSERIMSVVITPLLEGDIEMLAPLVSGLLLLTFFSHRLRGIYRTILLLFAAVLWGAGYVGMIGGPYYSIAELSSVTSWEKAFDVIFFIALLVYFIFNERIGQKLAPIRKLSNWCITAYFGLGIAIMWARFGNNLIGWTFRGIEGVGLYVGLIILGGVLIDAFVGWNKILGRTTDVSG